MIKKDNQKSMVLGRFESLAPLATGLAHEIKNPLSSLNINIQLLKEDIIDLPDNERLERKVEIIQKESTRMEEILNDFLRFAKPKELDLHLEDVHNIIDEIITFLLPEARQGSILIKKDYCKNLPPVNLDRNLIKQALFNLIINGQQAMPDGGVLSVHTLCNEESIQISVTDIGCGICAQNINKIFDIYYSSKCEGTGLGLPTVKYIVEEHGGSIDVTSTTGKGSSFTIVLPLNKII